MQNDIRTSKSAPSRTTQSFPLLTSTWKCASRHNCVHFFDITTSKCAPTLWIPEVFCTFWLGNMLRATTACTFSTSQLPKVVRPWCVLYILTWKCASRHNGVQLFISYLARWLRTRRFSEPTFRAPASSFFWLFLFSALLSSALLFSDSSHLCFSILSEVWLLNFLRLGCIRMY